MSQRVVTFLASPGVGRTMILANVAFQLAQTHGKRVLAIDLCLGSPSLHSFFGYDKFPDMGFVEYIQGLMEASGGGEHAVPPDLSLYVREPPRTPSNGSLRFICAGRLGPGYAVMAHSLDWDQFYWDNGHAAMEYLRDELLKIADVVLINAGGMDPVTGIAAMQLADLVCYCFGPSLEQLQDIPPVSRTILKIPPSQRLGREAPHMLFVPSKVPVEDKRCVEWLSYAEKTLSTQLPPGAMAAADYPQGLKTYMFPYVSKYTFDTPILGQSDVGTPFYGQIVNLAGVIASRVG